MWDSGSDTRQGAKERRKKMELKDLMKKKRGPVPDWEWKKRVYKELRRLYAIKGVSRVRVNWMMVERVNTPGDALYKKDAPQTEQSMRWLYKDVEKALNNGTITL